MPFFAATILVLTILVGRAAAQDSLDSISLRAENGEKRGRIITIDDAGVTIRLETERDIQRLYVWDLVREVRTTSPRSDLREVKQRAEKLWRARTRLQRGDTGLAEPLFAELFERYRGQTNEAAAIVAEGLLRCRIAHGENDRAILAMLESLRLRRAGIKTDRYEGPPDPFDAETGLCRQLPPAWTTSRTLGAVRAELERYTAPSDPIVESISSMYLVAVRRTLGEATPTPDIASLPEHPAITLLHGLLAANDPNIEERQRRIERWRQLLANDAVALWAHPWVRYAIGESMLRSTNPRTREDGVVQLLHVPVRDGSSQPYLAGLALAQAEQELAASGDAAGADRLRNELRSLTPNHPVLRDDRATRGPDASPTPSRTPTDFSRGF